MFSHLKTTAKTAAKIVAHIVLFLVAIAMIWIGIGLGLTADFANAQTIATVLVLLGAGVAALNIYWIARRSR